MDKMLYASPFTRPRFENERESWVVPRIGSPCTWIGSRSGNSLALKRAGCLTFSLFAVPICPDEAIKHAFHTALFFERGTCVYTETYLTHLHPEDGYSMYLLQYVRYIRKRGYSERTKSRVPMVTYCWPVTCFMNVSYVVGHVRAGSVLFQCVVSILWVLIILWLIDPLLRNGSINTFPRRQILGKPPVAG
jgi:hypothetical protein